MFAGTGADTFRIDWGDGETTSHSLWNGAELRARHDYAAGVSGTGMVHAESGGTDIATITFSVQTAPSGTSGTTLAGGAGVDVLIGHNGPDTLSGLGGNDMLSGGLGADTIDGGAGSDNIRGGEGSDTLTGGSGNDTFVFQPGFGHDTINDFAAGAGSDDVIEFDDAMFADFAAVLAASQQVGSDVQITVDASNSILLNDVALSNLHQDDFRFF
jgi:Ca2+-binding RTX toxin-like protein